MLVGNTLAERQQLFNHFETSLLTRFPELELTVRNLGWSGDTPALQPRPLNFGDAATHLTAQRADVILAFFGLNESFAGEAGVAAFERDLEAWVTLHRAARYNGKSAPRIVLVSPIAHERLARLVHVDAEARNRELARYTEAMRSLAARLDVPFVDVFTPMRAAMAASPEPLTINGIHLNETGDRVFAGILMTALGFEPAPSDTSATALKALRHAARAGARQEPALVLSLPAAERRVRRRPARQPVRVGELPRRDEAARRADRRAGPADLAPGPDHRQGRGAMTRHAAAAALLALALAGVARRRRRRRARSRTSAATSISPRRIPPWR